jgi:hypothetical protein
VTRALELTLTRWVDECCSSLAEKAEYPTDIWVPHIINASKLSYRIMSMTEGFEGMSDDAVFDTVAKAFERDLADLQTALPLDKEGSPIPLPGTYMKQESVVQYRVTIR